MDITNFKLADKSEEGSVLTIVHPTEGFDTDIKIKLAGLDSHRYREHVRRIANKRMANKKNAKQTFEQLEHQTAELFAMLTIDWEGIEENGAELTCNFENAMRIYLDPNLKFLVDQVDEFVNERSNFF